ncbi:hypothetical protein VOLCADRAFT_92318 [Volvox carteri f. nagariensis]|uniref:Uncharacterized protein n=1 Tax=Volvox carteri f. nagariensis TaxID=3068 RepID=D8TZC6_VOLCA|nr:uncharacterized protein VOLCADRAFT_92318 [Volvox carteri f. nagariensis]EFJ47251.1 hypothetical protein VOLCADRAFT_92318 [Volvox carteri f. nagariensis]|eukprot:XP_002951800.1 hypothetical protein VOLCADRAFT_92318 [Volvox carteri f. nagariensis]
MYGLGGSLVCPHRIKVARWLFVSLKPTVTRHPLDMVKQAFEFPTQLQQVWVSPLMQLQAPPLQDIRPEWMLQPWVSDVGGGDCNSHDDSKGRLKAQTFSA